jgi:hypothetical protein
VQGKTNKEGKMKKKKILALGTVSSIFPFSFSGPLPFREVRDEHC